MSWAEKIYYTKTSGYANLAVLTGAYKQDFDIYEYFSKKEQLKIIEKYVNLPYIHNFQKSFACFCAFRISKELKLSFEQTKFWLKKALKFNDSNDAFHILWLECLFLEHKVQEAEIYLKNLLQTRKNDFLQTLFYDGFERYNYDFVFKLFLQNAGEKFPNISYVAFLIALNLGFDEYLKNPAFKNFKVDLSFKKAEIWLGAEFIMKNHLSYQLGEAMARNSYSLKGILKNPFDMLKIYLNFKKQKFSHSLPLCEYKDYARAVKFVKNHAFYKLGSALIKAQKSWYKLGYFYFLKEVLKISKEYKKERKKFKQS